MGLNCIFSGYPVVYKNSNFLSVSTISSFVVAHEDVDECEEGWTDGGSVGLGCLLFNQEGKTHDWAAMVCQDLGGHLVEIHSLPQLEFLRSELKSLEADIGPHDWWTGGSDAGREGQWYWQTSLTPVDSFVWYWPEGHPMDITSLNYLTLFSSMDYMGVEYPFDLAAPYAICQKM